MGLVCTAVTETCNSNISIKQIESCSYLIIDQCLDVPAFANEYSETFIVPGKESCVSDILWSNQISTFPRQEYRDFESCHYNNA